MFMSLLDSLGSLVGGSKSGPAALLPVLLEQLKKYPGGLAGLVDSFRKGGLGEIVASWIGKGNNLPVSIDQLRNVLPASLVGSLAQESGQDDNTVLSLLSTLLPEVVDKATPEGEVKEGQGFDAAGLLGSLSGLLGKFG
ncbi:YidB family protein [Kerstersia gyiorum]|uniref:YidB family protein n=1 Tax=Kerstersia gyiorum TaxID=206506 RepID=UPI00356400CE